MSSIRQQSAEVAATYSSIGASTRLGLLDSRFRRGSLRTVRSPHEVQPTERHRTIGELGTASGGRWCASGLIRPNFFMLSLSWLERSHCDGMADQVLAIVENLIVRWTPRMINREQSVPTTKEPKSLLTFLFHFFP